MEQVLVDFRPWYVKRGYTSSKRIILVFILTFYASPLHWYWILCFSHLWKLPSPVEFCCHILINKGKYQNILPMPVFANSPCCMLIGWFLWTEMLIPKMIMSEMAISKIFMSKIWELSLIWLLLVLHVNFVSGFRFKFNYIYLIVSIRSNFIFLYVFWMVVLLSYWLIEITSFVFPNGIN